MLKHTHTGAGSSRDEIIHEIYQISDSSTVAHTTLKVIEVASSGSKGGIFGVIGATLVAMAMQFSLFHFGARAALDLHYGTFKPKHKVSMFNVFFPI